MLRQIFCVLLFLFVNHDVTSGQFSIPDLKLYALTPRGFRAELADQPGIELFAFHGKLNDKLDASKEGDITGDVNTATDGKWVFEDPGLELTVGDKIHYWVYVQHNRAGYNKRDQTWEVTQTTTGNVGCSEAATVASGVDVPVCAGKIIFEDNFNEATINRNKWIVQKYIPTYSGDDNYEFVSYQDKDTNRFIRNSVLYLKPTAASTLNQITGELNLRQGCTRSGPESCFYKQIGANLLPPVTSAKILSGMSFRYGKIEIKAKVPIGDWIYPQIELIPKNILPPYPKILIAYTRGNLNLTLNSNDDIGNTILFGGPASSRVEPQRSERLKSYRSITPLGADMRTYTLIWSPTRIDLMVDSEQYGTLFSSEYSGFNAEYQISLGVGVGGNIDFPDDVRSGNYQKPWKNFEPKLLKDFYGQRIFWYSTWRGDDVALQIDSVKVWAV